MYCVNENKDASLILFSIFHFFLLSLFYNPSGHFFCFSLTTTYDFEIWHKVSKGAKIRNRYNQVPGLTQDTNGNVTNSQQTPQTRAKRSALSQQVITKLDSDELYCVTKKQNSYILLISPLYLFIFLPLQWKILSQISQLLLEPVF